MKEAIGTSYVFNFVIIFVGVMIALLIGSIAYTKGFKIRNRIINIIEKHEGYDNNTEDEIKEDLRTIGYQNTTKKCGNHNGRQPFNNNSGYNYCIYQYSTAKGPYYGVKVFIHFDIPIIGDFVEIPLYGESRIIFNKDEVEG
ncbi:MAG: hypothetical protein RSB71_00315 [Bacilli bacterium]